MAFNVSTVEDRISEFPNRRTLTKENGTSEVVTVTRNEGEVSKEGTAWGATYANDLESRINTETNLLETNFGHVEPTTTASKPYSVGETLVLNGTMYKVTAPISVGNTLTVGTNIAVHSLSAINSNMNKIKTYVGGDKKLHFIDGTGADTALNFSSGFAYLTGITSSANGDSNYYFYDSVSITVPEITTYGLTVNDLLLTSKVFSGAMSNASMSVSGNFVTIDANISNYLNQTTSVAFMVSKKNQ